MKTYEVENFVIIPKHFFTTGIIQKRKPLSQNARRAGWVGCNILLNDIPKRGKIFYVKDGKIKRKEDILSDWKRTLFLRDKRASLSKGWTLDVMNCIDKLNKKASAK